MIKIKIERTIAEIKEPEISKSNKVSKKTGKDYNQIILDLFNEGFFVAPVTAKQVRDRVSRRGIVMSSRISANMNSKLTSLVKSKKIAKFKQRGVSVYQER